MAKITRHGLNLRRHVTGFLDPDILQTSPVPTRASRATFSLMRVWSSLSSASNCLRAGVQSTVSGLESFQLTVRQGFDVMLAEQVDALAVEFC